MLTVMVVIFPANKSNESFKGKKILIYLFNEDSNGIKSISTFPHSHEKVSSLCTKVYFLA